MNKISNAKKQILSFTGLLISILFFMTTNAYADMKLYEGEPSVDDCRKCHGDDEHHPHPLLQKSVTQVHHELVSKPIKGLFNGYYDSVAPGDISSGSYECVSCHSYDGDTPIVEKDCLSCHPKNSLISRPRPDIKNVHHATLTFEKRDCVSCHRFLNPQKWPRKRGMKIYKDEPNEAECRRCHGDDNSQPHPALKEPNADRHHDLIGNPIEGFYDGFFDTVAPGDISSGEYECLSCHIYENSNYVAPHDCMKCHIKRSVISRPRPDVKNVHHNTQTFRDKNCNGCHRFY